MSRLARMRAWCLAFTDSFLPAAALASSEIHRLRMTLFYVWMGVGFTGAYSVLYAAAGSPISALAVVLVTLSLIVTTFAIRRGVAIPTLAHLMVGATWVMTAVVASRSGGFASPVLVNVFIFPLVTYAVIGPRAAAGWAALACVQIVAFGGLDLAGHAFAQDFPASTLAILRTASYIGDVAAIMLALAIVTTARAATYRAESARRLEVERERVLDDVHDGVGAQLLGLLVQVRADSIARERIAGGLESCLDDLRLVVSSEATREGDLSSALDEVERRFAPRFEAAKMPTRWSVELRERELDGVVTLQTVRVLQEMLTNTIRHAPGAAVEVEVTEDTNERVLSVRDHGPGFRPTTVGRGLHSMHARASKLGARLTITTVDPGTRVELRIPRA